MKSKGFQTEEGLRQGRRLIRLRELWMILLDYVTTISKICVGYRDLRRVEIAIRAGNIVIIAENKHKLEIWNEVLKRN